MYNLKELAEAYFELGLKPTCITYLKTKYNISEANPEKSPSHPWRRWQVRNPSIADVISLPWNNANGIGTVLGYANRCIDIDNCSSISFIKEVLKFLQLPEDYEWTVKTPNGFHIHVTAGNLLFLSNNELIEGVLSLLPNEINKKQFKRLELRWANHAVLPPTKINGLNYEFVFKGDSLPLSKPSYLSQDKIFRFIAKYCGSTSFNERTSTWNNIIINNLFYNLAYPSEYPGPHLVVFDLEKCSDKVIYSPDLNNYIFDWDKFEESDLAGVWHDPKWPPWESFGWTSHIPVNPLFIDIETTGLVKNEFDYYSYPRIIQIAHSIGYNSEIFSQFIKPNDFSVSKEIQDLTGITNELLNEKGIPIYEALKVFRDKNKFSPIIVFNADFDLPILDGEFMRCKENSKLAYIENYLRDGSQVICLMKKYAEIFGGKYPKLSEMYVSLFKEDAPSNFHNATNDLNVLIDSYYLLELYGYFKLSNKGKTIA